MFDFLFLLFFVCRGVYEILIFFFIYWEMKDILILLGLLVKLRKFS